MTMRPDLEKNFRPDGSTYITHPDGIAKPSDKHLRTVAGVSLYTLADIYQDTGFVNYGEPMPIDPDKKILANIRFESTNRYKEISENSVLGELVTPDGEPVKNIFEAEPRLLAVVLTEHLYSYYEAANKSLKISLFEKEIKRKKRNRNPNEVVIYSKYTEHGTDTHILPGLMLGLSLCADAQTIGLPPHKLPSAPKFVISYANHDIAADLEREKDGELSVLKTRYIMPWLYKDERHKDDMAEIEQGMELHSLRRFLGMINTNKYGTNADEVIEGLMQDNDISQTAYMTFLADHLQRKDRISVEDRTQNDFDTNMHLPLNYFLETNDQNTRITAKKQSTARIDKTNDKNNRTFTWNIAFNRHLPDTITDEEKMTLIPTILKEKHVKEGTPYFKLLQDEFWRLSSRKIFAVVIAAFTAFDLETFTLSFSHPTDQEQNESVTFERGKVQEKILEVRNSLGIRIPDEGVIL